MITFHVITLFPESLSSYLDASIIARAKEKGKIQLKLYNPRDFMADPHRRVDKRPYGGGPGMVLDPWPVIKAIEKAKGRKKQVEVVHFSPSGPQFSDAEAKNLSTDVRHIILVCGRYEGVDARVKEAFPGQVFSIGPYVVTGGELPAMVVIDAVTRQIEGVLGDPLSVEDRRIASSDVYTRPARFTYKGVGYSVPEVLLEGNHKEIDQWRKEH